MKKIVLALFLILMLAVLTSCAQLTSGTCIDKKYVGAYTTTSIRLIPAGKVLIPVSQVNHYPEAWEILVEGFNDKNELVQEWWTVDQESWETISIGDQVENANQ